MLESKPSRLTDERLAEIDATRIQGILPAASALSEELLEALKAERVDAKIREEQLEMTYADVERLRREVKRLQKDNAQFVTELERGGSRVIEVVRLGKEAKRAKKLQAKLDAANIRTKELEHWFHGYRTPELSMSAMLTKLEKVAALPEKWRGHSYWTMDENWNVPHKQGLIKAAIELEQALENE